MNSSEEDRLPKTSEYAENLALLREISFFAGLPLEPLKVLAYLCERERFGVGEYLFRQNDPEGKAFHILSGRAELQREDMGHVKALSDYMQGAFIGGLSLLADTNRLFSLRSVDETVCLTLTRERFAKTLGQFPDIVPKLLVAVVKSVSSWESQFFLDHAEICELCRSRMGVSLI
ncbi:cyclic nucleotide-binding protein [Desulfocurvibacter africanus PCS]|uniref:Cyclic nucleotide-binding protein n=1 Tax=Desulfocurvibacter africanus PCS TaxID=1262666 RepID=M5PVG2_DESAF|nr:cyclic nucleotide-binding domain-containing protein [Desulfocurvibacter africanus]EMG38332.1 cyclic nucleotide-binding protein [Desulfocurvibacter africanus PCS]